MLVSHRKAGASTPQIYRLTAPMGELEQLTDFAEPVSQASYEPRTGDSIVFERSTGGDEASQIYRLDLATRQVTRRLRARHAARSRRLAEPEQPADLFLGAAGPHRRRRAACRDRADADAGRSGPSGRAAQARRASGRRLGCRQRIVGRPPSRAQPLSISANHSEVWLLDLASGERTRVLPPPGNDDKAVYLAGVWKRDNSGFFFVSDRSGEFRELMFYSLADARSTSITRHIKGDIEGASLSHDGKLLAVRAKVEGRTHLVFFDAAAFNELPSPALPEGSVTTASFHPRLPLLGFALNSSKGPSQIGTLVPADGGSQAWTRPHAPPGVDTAGFAEQQIVRWKSFDGREITGHRRLSRRPLSRQAPGADRHPRRARGRRASSASWAAATTISSELGVAVIRPNVRGSSGFGKTFLTLDNGKKREDSVKDIGALLDWIATQPRPRRRAGWSSPAAATAAT